MDRRKEGKKKAEGGRKGDKLSSNRLKFTLRKWYSIHWKISANHSISLMNKQFQVEKKAMWISPAHQNKDLMSYNILLVLSSKNSLKNLNYTHKKVSHVMQRYSAPVKSFISWNGIKQRSNYLRTQINLQNKLWESNDPTDTVQSYDDLMLRCWM